MSTILKIVLRSVGVALLAIGVMWLVAPAEVAEELGMPLLEGSGHSTQIGGLAAFFTASAVLILIGATTGKRHRLDGTAMLLGPHGGISDHCLGRPRCGLCRGSHRSGSGNYGPVVARCQPHPVHSVITRAHSRAL